MIIPPFGKPLYDLIQSGKRPHNSINVFIGRQAWQKGRAFSKPYPCRTIAIPPFHDPLKYNFPVTNCDVLIFDTGGCDAEYIECIVFELLLNQAAIVRVIAEDFTYFGTYKKDL